MADNNGPSSSLDNLSERAYEIARRRQTAALQVVAMLEDDFETWFASSASTVLHACAWLAGTSLYRGLETVDGLTPGSAQFSERSNEEGLKLMKVFMFLVDKDSIQLKPDDFAAAIPAAHRPLKSLADVQAHFQDRYSDIMTVHGFDDLEGARTGAVACARLMKLHCLNRTDLEPPVAASIVSIGFVEGAQAGPAPSEGGNTSNPA